MMHVPYGPSSVQRKTETKVAEQSTSVKKRFFFFFFGRRGWGWGWGVGVEEWAKVDENLAITSLWPRAQCIK